MNTPKRYTLPLIAALALLLMTACAARGPYETKRDKTARGAAIGAGAGALFSILDGKTEADEILARAAIGAVIGGGIGAYMDAQEERLARIPGTTVERVDGNTLLVRFDSDVLFAVNKSDLNSRARQTLNDAAIVFAEYKKTAVVVQGHTDSTGDEAYNQRLSEQRAQSVLNYLAAQGVARERMQATGYGERVPVASNETQSGRAQNRRVTILLRAKAR